eukprot:CAMPEP_0113684446 /NCGR_PEP_ID=MMETSP0038_2-20120614/14010_1 /TAXON_ID=2898 /ORGANISM="Cryptomonas paramecium" /LENGTH=213 /DNA_ID=CAMNT_0000604201 /DNA_START=179 /DNA_END=817 /DNA_ORIENTATION=+ /assembly_acc=CAM_ASM_000170
MADYLEAAFSQDVLRYDELLKSGRQYTAQSMVTISQFMEYLSTSIQKDVDHQQATINWLQREISTREVEIALNKQYSSITPFSAPRTPLDARVGLASISPATSPAAPVSTGTACIFDLSSYDYVGTSLASEDERRKDADYLKDRLRRPSVRHTTSIPPTTRNSADLSAPPRTNLTYIPVAQRTTAPQEIVPKPYVPPRPPSTSASRVKPPPPP